MQAVLKLSSLQRIRGRPPCPYALRHAWAEARCTHILQHMVDDALLADAHAIVLGAGLHGRNGRLDAKGQDVGAYISCHLHVSNCDGAHVCGDHL